MNVLAESNRQVSADRVTNLEEPISTAEIAWRILRGTKADCFRIRRVIINALYQGVSDFTGYSMRRTTDRGYFCCSDHKVSRDYIQSVIAYICGR